MLHVCVFPGEQNTHRVSEHFHCDSDQGAGHQPARPKGCLEVCLPSALYPQCSRQYGHGMVGQIRLQYFQDSLLFHLQIVLRENTI